MAAVANLLFPHSQVPYTQQIDIADLQRALFQLKQFKNQEFLKSLLEVRVVEYKGIRCPWPFKT